MAKDTQHKLFVEAARELGCSDDEKGFDRTLKKLAKAPPPSSVQKRKSPAKKTKLEKSAKQRS